MKSNEISFALETAEGALCLINGPERKDAERLVELCRSFFQSGFADEAMAKEVGALVEVLARRSAQAMPFAALGRGLIASMRGDELMIKPLLAEFHLKLSQLGL